MMAVLVEKMCNYTLNKTIQDHSVYLYRVQVIKNRVALYVILNVRKAIMVWVLFAGTNAMENLFLIVGSIA